MQTEELYLNIINNLCDGVYFADIDNFGKFNNDYGHDTGDLVLINIGESLMCNVRKNDMVGRWGGLN